MDNQNLENLKKIAKIFQPQNIITSTEIDQVLKGIMEILATYKKGTESINEDTKQVVNNLLEQVIKYNTETISDFKSEADKVHKERLAELQTLLSDIKSMVLDIETMASELEDGKDADEEKIVEEVISRIKIDPTVITVSAQEIRDKLASLKDEERLDKSAIKGLEKILMQKDLDYAIATLQQQTSFLINKGAVRSIVAGTNITVDNTDPSNPIISASGGGSGSPGGSDTQLQYNNTGSFGGITGATSDGTTVTLTSPTIATSQTNSYATASTIGIFNGSKQLISADTATYPTLTELSYVKGVTSSIQTQLNAKGSGTVTSVSVVSANGFTGSSSGGATPALTLTTSINSPVLAGNGTAISAATTTGSGSTVMLGTSPNLTTSITGNTSSILTFPNAATWQLGAADAASPVAQTLQVQSVVAGTSNTAGTDWTEIQSLSTGTGTAGNKIYNAGFAGKGTASTTVTITIATPGVVTWTAHGFVTGQPVVFTTTGALPTGITSGTTYYAICTSTLGINTFQIATSAANAQAGTAITTSGTQSGTHTGTTSATVQNPSQTLATWGPSGLTGSQTTPALSLAQTWNTSGAPNLLNLNVTNVTSSSGSLLNMQTNGNNTFKFRADGTIIGYNSSGSQAYTLSYGTGLSISGNAGGTIMSFGNWGGGVLATRLPPAGLFQWDANSANNNTPDTTLSRPAAATIQLGAPSAASPVNQTLTTQGSRSGTDTNVGGANLTIQSGNGTGTGTPSSLIFQAPVAVGSGTGAQTQTTFLTGTGTLATFAVPVTLGTSNSLTTGTIELGAASDTTLSRSSAGVLAVEGVVIPSISSTNTLTNKFITPQLQSVADAGGTLTPISITNDMVIATALSQATTIAAPTGSPVQGEKLVIRLKDNGTARALTWNAIYRAIGVTLPTTTVISKTVYCGFIYNSTDTKWDCVAVAQEA